MGILRKILLCLVACVTFAFGATDSAWADPKFTLTTTNTATKQLRTVQKFLAWGGKLPHQCFFIRKK